MSYDVIRNVIEGQAEPQKEHNALDINAPNKGIVEGDGLLEDVRDLLIRKLEAEGIYKADLEKWLTETGRIAEGTGVESLSTTMAQSMVDNLDTLVKQIKK